MLGAIIVVWDSAQGENADYDKHTVHVPSAALPWVNFALGASHTAERYDVYYWNARCQKVCFLWIRQEIPHAAHTDWTELKDRLGIGDSAEVKADLCATPGVKVRSPERGSPHHTMSESTL